MVRTCTVTSEDEKAPDRRMCENVLMLSLYFFSSNAY